MSAPVGPDSACLRFVESARCQLLPPMRRSVDDWLVRDRARRRKHPGVRCKGHFDSEDCRFRPRPRDDITCPLTLARRENNASIHRLIRTSSRNPSTGSTPQPTHHSRNSAMSIRRLAASDLNTQDCDFPTFFAKSRCVKRASSRIFFSSVGTLE